ncbi:MAG TPA: hypothetical protein VLT62_24725 [Candidatus Methylomirabilis sp.]|nr:hypothetical protein [Candidatus Methylomirabilis sp.]
MASPLGHLVVGLGVAGAALLSHLVLDVLCTGPPLGGQRHGVPVFWPFTPHRWYVREPMLPEVNLLERPSPRTIARFCLQELLHLTPTACFLILLGHLRLGERLASRLTDLQLFH